MYVKSIKSGLIIIMHRSSEKLKKSVLVLKFFIFFCTLSGKFSSFKLFEAIGIEVIGILLLIGFTSSQGN